MRTPAALAVLLCMLVFAAESSAVIGRADLDGSNANGSFIGGEGGYSIAVDEGHVYWTNSETIGRAGLDGSSVDQDFIDLGGVHPGDLAVDDQHIYWTSSDDSIGRAELDGTGVDQVFVPNAVGQQARDTLFALAVDSGHLYWSWMEDPSSGMSQNWIGRADLAGTDVSKKLLNTIGGPAYWGHPGGLAVNADGIYWSEGVVIGRADLDGTDVTSPFLTVCPPSDEPPLSLCSASSATITGLAADDSHIYFAGFYEQPPSFEYASAIGRADLDPTDIFDTSPVATLAPAPPSPPRGLAVGDGHVYWSRGTTVVKGSTSAKDVQKQGGSKVVVKAKVKAKELLFAQARGEIDAGKNTYELEDVDFTRVPPGTSKTLKLKPKRDKDAEEIVKRLKQGKKASAKLKVQLRDDDGNEETEKLSVKLER